MGINMKMIKGFLFVVTGLFILITLVSLLMPSRIMTAKTVMINSDDSSIMAAIEDLQQWKNWHPVFMDEQAGVKIPGPSAGANAYAVWETNGKENKLQITNSTPGQVTLSLQRPGENEVINLFSLATIKDSPGIQVEWRTTTTLKWYPWEKFSGIFYDKMTGPGYEAALQSLKKYAEGRPAP